MFRDKIKMATLLKSHRNLIIFTKNAGDPSLNTKIKTITALGFE